jgi:hypothetical protein
MDAIPRVNIEQVGGTDVAPGMFNVSVELDIEKVAGNAILTGGLAGSQGVGGLAAQNAALAGNPVPVAGQFRTAELALSALGVAAPGLNEQGYLAAEADWNTSVLDGGGQRVSIGTAAYSAALTAGAKYIIIAKADCWIKFGASDTDPAVLGSDFFLPKTTPVQFTVKAGGTYLAVITDSDTVSNGLSICRVK